MVRGLSMRNEGQFTSIDGSRNVTFQYDVRLSCKLSHPKWRYRSRSQKQNLQDIGNILLSCHISDNKARTLEFYYLLSLLSPHVFIDTSDPPRFTDSQPESVTVDECQRGSRCPMVDCPVSRRVIFDVTGSGKRADKSTYHLFPSSTTTTKVKFLISLSSLAKEKDVLLSALKG